MLKILTERFRQGHRTLSDQAPPSLPSGYQGLPVLSSERCEEGCTSCAEVCPTGAVSPGPLLDLGACLFCGECARACPEGAISFGKDHRMAVRSRSDLVLTGQELKLAEALEARSRQLFGRSLKLRQVSAGGCNACEAEINVLSTVVFDLGRFGVQVVASPRHADGLIVTGPVSQNMREALLKTYQAVPEPRLVIAVGACATAGGPYRDHPEVESGVGGILPVDLFIPGCPPHPLTILDGLLRLLGRRGVG
ncbi:NADH-quinone oxidoreductase subunit NuoB [bacterium CPR1]|nr:NADH-quinone oxidoreductase subunit NuoB [bacterium CPR1]